MMSSPERELLKNASDILKHLNYDDDLIANGVIWKIEKLLAQPEHIPDVGNMVEQELFKPDWANYRQGVEDSKREPLSGDRLRDASNSINAYPDFENVSVWQIFYLPRAIEKAHGIEADNE